MSVVDTPGVVCPRCQAIFLSRRDHCVQCGETIPTIEVIQTAPSASIAESYGFKPNGPRRIRRKEVSILAVILGEGGAVRSEIHIANICERGLLFRSAQSYAEGDRLRIRLSIDGWQGVVAGELRRVMPILDPAWKFSCGLEFVSPDRTLLREIAKLPDD